MKNHEVPIWEKTHLTIQECAAFTNIGEKKITAIAKDNPDLVLKVGVKTLLNRSKLIKFLDSQFVV